MASTKRIDLYMSDFEKSGYIGITQNDNDGVQLICTLKNSPDSTAFAVPVSAKVIFMGAKQADGTGVILSTDDPQPRITFSGNVVNVTVPQSVTATKGLVLCKLVVQEGASTVSTQVFRLSCAEDIAPDNLVDSPEYQSLVTMLNHLGSREAEFDDLKEQYYQAVNGTTVDSEVINARIDGVNSITYTTLKLRLDAIAQTLKGLVSGNFETRMTGVEGELLAARGGEAALATRLGKMDQANTNVSQEVTNARNGEPSLDARLDKMDTNIANNLTTIDGTKIKLVNVERELDTLQRTVEMFNPNQEVKQTVEGYGSVSLPKNASNGNLETVVSGLSYKNELNYNRDTWAEWSRDSGFVGDSTGLEFTISGSAYKSAKINTVCKPNTKYILLFDVVNNTAPNVSVFAQLADVLATGVITGGKTGRVKVMFTTGASITLNNLKFQQGNLTDDGLKIKITNVRVIEANAQIETDFNTMTADQLALKYPYVQGGAVRNTSGTYRLKGINKNLFDKKKIKAGKYYSSAGSLVDSYNSEYIDLYIKVTPSTKYYVNKSVLVVAYDINKVFVERIAGIVDSFTTGKNVEYIRVSSYQVGLGYLEGLQIETGGVTPYEPYKFTEKYFIGKEYKGLPNGVGDSDGVQRVSNEEILTADRITSLNTSTSALIDIIFISNINFITQTSGNNFAKLIMTDGREITVNKVWSVGEPWTYYQVAGINEIRLAIPKGYCVDLADAKVKFTGTKITYQLATPITYPIQSSGTLQSYPSGTVFREPAIGDAGLYTDKMSILNTAYPIKALETLSKINFDTGVATELPIANAVIASDGKSFTHPQLTNGELNTFTYIYDNSNYTEGKLAATYYDSRVVKKDTVNGKFYKEVVTLTNGVATTTWVEV